MRRAWIYLAAAALAAAALLVALRRPSPPSAPPAAVTPRAAVAPAPAPPPPAEPPAAEPEAPRQLQDTEVDGELTSDSRGDLVVTPDVRRFFDYFLVASSDQPSAVIRGRVAAELAKRLAPKAAAQAENLLDRYLRYRERAAEVQTRVGDDVEAQLAALWDLRREVIGARDATALFGDDEELVRDALERQRIMEDPRISDEEKQAKLAAAEARLPEKERAARAAAVAPIQLLQEEQTLRANGGSEEAIRALREQRLGREAADRLESLDRENAAWQARLDAFREQRDAIAIDPNLSNDERARATEDLLYSSFDAQERLRVKALLGD
jgi:lipase chaperone LimK